MFEGTSASAGLLRELLGKIQLEPVTPDIGKPYFRAMGKGQILAVLSHYPFIPAGKRKADPLKTESADNESGDPGSNSWHWWTRSQSIRTEAELPFEAALMDTSEPTLYQKIAQEASRMHRLGMSKRAIARSLKVDAKVVCKALAWITTGGDPNRR